MKKKITQIITILMGAGIVLFLTVADFASQDRTFSETENRVLAKLPKFSFKELFAGDYTSDFETYVTDQFVWRDGWIALKTQADIALGKKDVGGVYLAKDGGLVEKHDPTDIDGAEAEKKVTLLSELITNFRDAGTFQNFHVMLVPTADNIQTHRLPDYAPYFDQKTYIQHVAETLGEEYMIDVWETLSESSSEYIYYRTDHHWTTYGAYLGYLEWAKEMNVTPVSFEGENRVLLSEDFLGTLHSKTNLDLEPDMLETYLPSGEGQFEVYYDMLPSAKDSIFEAKHLDTKNKYGYFMDDNHGVVAIKTGNQNGKTLFVIKDSYANCMVPFLTEHYETICVIDLRYCNVSIYSLVEMLMQTYAPQGEYDMLVLYNVIHFIDEFKYWK